MKFRVYIYPVIRIIMGMSLVLYSVYNVIKYRRFLDRLDHYFDQASIFDIGFIEALAPLVPFEEFVIGIFLVLNIFKRKVLIASIPLFGFFTLFLLDVNQISCAFIYAIFCVTAIILLKKDKYDLYADRNSADSFRMIQ
ncbi:MauE/DoxX family redox-associated membrane protein [Aquimarina aggregata]|uniref:MauE/DoxX family redox-associated membrane protein n=1 Tax=Aquimarina aggregata TaxID=1642818 RepID=UPI0024929ABC|nr:MauE/DoxX family redox-associated membrane protein [Aquimarina aggregata]